MGIEFTFKTPRDMRGVLNEIKNELENNVFSLLKDFKKFSEKEFFKSLLKKMNKSDYDKIVLGIKKNKTKAFLELENKIKDTIEDITSGAELPQKVIDTINLSMTTSLIEDLGGTLNAIESNTSKLISKVMLKEMEFDRNWILKEGKYNIDDIISDYKYLTKNDYGQNIMNELLKDESIKKQFEEGSQKFYKDGKYYDFESYIEQRTEWAQTEVVRQVKESEVKEDGLNVVRFVIIINREVTEPRPHHEEHEGKLFWINEPVDEYEGESVKPISDIDEYEPFNAPYGCRHGLISPDEMKGE